MARYAEGTTVLVGKTRGEIETLVDRYGARSFGSGWLREDRAMVTFEEEFLAHIVTVDNLTVYEQMKISQENGSIKLLSPVTP